MSDPSVAMPPPANLGERVARRTSASSMMFRRWAAAWVDFIALFLILAAPTLLVGGVGGFDRPGSGAPVIIGLGLAVLYFPVLEGFWGRTLGRVVTGTTVVNKAGGVPGIGRALVRTVLRLVEVNPFLLGGIPAGVIAANTEGRQRIGDLLAQTYVVPVKDLAQARAKAMSAEAATFD